MRTEMLGFSIEKVITDLGKGNGTHVVEVRFQGVKRRS